MGFGYDANPNSRTEIGTRLVLTRKALDYTQATMAGLMGVDGQTLAAYEAGRRRIPMKQALDWIYQGGQPTPAHPRQDSGAGAPILERALGQRLELGPGAPCTRHANATRKQGGCN